MCGRRKNFNRLEKQRKSCYNKDLKPLLHRQKCLTDFKYIKKNKKKPESVFFFFFLLPTSNTPLTELTVNHRQQTDRKSLRAAAFSPQFKLTDSNVDVGNLMCTQKLTDDRHPHNEGGGGSQHHAVCHVCKAIKMREF